MSKHLFGLCVTSLGTAANNRGDTEGNITTLQKLLWNGEVHTTVSAEALMKIIPLLGGIYVTGTTCPPCSPRNP